MQDVLDNAHKYIDDANRWLNDRSLDVFAFDNAAVLLPTIADVQGFVLAATNAGMEHFARSHEHVSEFGVGGSAYEVAFDFLRWPSGTYNGRPFRIEAMHIAGGYSPCHEKWMRDHDYGVVQVSLKVTNLRQMSRMALVLDGLGLRRQHVFAADYGLYDYWSGMDYPWPADAYLKTRVNMRDA